MSQTQQQPLSDAEKKKMNQEGARATERAVTKLIMKEPFYGHVLSGVNRIVSVDCGVPTAAVGGKKGSSDVMFFVNPQFFNGLKSREEQCGVVKHECLHLILHHIHRGGSGNRDPRILNIACDLVVNQYVVTGHAKLPDSAVLLDQYPDLKFEEKQTVDYYYYRLIKLYREMRREEMRQQGQSQQGQQQNGQQQGQQNGAGQGQQGQGQQQGQGSQQGSQGSQQGSQQGQGKPTDYSGTSAPQSAESLRRALGPEGENRHSNHSQWGEGDAELAEATLDRIISRAAKKTQSWGHLPGMVQAAIQAALDRLKPRVDWKRQLRLFAANSERTTLTTTISRVSRRFGTIPGLRIKRQKHVLLMIDTSGSVTDQDLSVFFAEIHSMHRTGAQITICEADAAVGRVWEYKGKYPEAISGRGGTVFNPALEWLRANHKERNFDCAMYLTDGYAASPTVKSPIPLMWVITDGGTADAVKDHGRVICLGDFKK